MPTTAPCAVSGAAVSVVASDSVSTSRFASPKSSTFARPSGVTMTFGALEVPVHDSVLVRVRQGVGHLLAQARDVLDPHPRAREPLAQRLAGTSSMAT